MIPPSFPALDAPLPSFDDPLRRTGDAAGDAPFTVTGRRAEMAGGEARGIDEIRIDGVAIVGALRVEGARATDFVATPIGVERHLEVAGRPVVERLLVPRDLPAVVLEWAAPGGATLEIAWAAEPLPGGGAAGWRRGDAALLTGDPEAGPAAAIVVGGAAGAWEVAEAPAGADPAVRCRVRVDLEPGGSVRLAVAASVGGDVALRAILAELRPEILGRDRAAAARRVRERWISVRSPDASLDEALGWSKVRLDAAPPVPGPGSVGAPAQGGPAGPAAPSTVRGASVDPRLAIEVAVRAALGALAAGDFDTARETVRRLGALQGSSGAIPGGPAATSLYLLLLSRFLTWTGELHTVRAMWGRVRSMCADLLEAEPAGEAADADPLRAAALRELALAAESIGDTELAAQLEVRGGVPSDAPHGVVDAMALIFPELAGFGAGRSAPAQAVGPLPPAAPPSPTLPEAFETAEAAAAAIVGVVHGLLGVEPDATRHRIVLRPRLPSAWDRLEVRALRLGDAEITVRYHREGDRHIFRLDQELGGVPVRLIFEPVLPAARLVAASVDGEPAELDPRPVAGGLAVPIQIVLDHERTVELRAESGRPRFQLPVR